MAEHSYDTPTKSRPKTGPADEDAFPNIQSGRYELISVLGYGGAGTVFRALDTVLKKEVAIKKLHSATAAQAIRFQREAKLAGALKHENVLSALDFGVTNENEPYLILDFENGESLASYTKRAGRLPIDEALKIAIQIATGLHHAHKNGVIHRDIKPSNIILVDQEKGVDTLRLDRDHQTSRSFSIKKASGIRIAKIVDFGLAKSVYEAQELTQIGTGLGTPKYMSPEQVHGMEVDERSDIYSFGCLMFEILTGKVPFQGQTALQTLEMHLNMPPPSMASRDADCSEELELIVNRCLQKDPEDRFQSAGDLLAKLKIELEEVEKTNQLNANESLEITELENQPANVTHKKKNHRYLWILCALSVFMLLVVWLLRDSDQKQVRSTTKLYDGPSVLSGKDEKIVEEEGPLSDGYRFHTSHAEDSDIKSFLKKKSNARRLDSLDMGDSTLTRASFELLGKKAKLKKLSYTMQPLTKSNLSNFSLIPTLIDVRLGADKTKIEPGALLELSKLPNLETLYIGQTNLHEQAVEEISHIKKLKVLQLTGCKGLSSKGLEHLAKSKELENLRLDRTDVTDGAVGRLSNHPRISLLILRGSSVTDKVLDSLAKMRSLQYVDLIDCKNVTRGAVERFKTKHSKVTVEWNQLQRTFQMDGLETFDPGLQ